MRSQSSNSIFCYISSELLAGTPEEEHANNLIGFPHPWGNFSAEHPTGIRADVISESNPFCETHLWKNDKENE
ncbi:unnamed protein product [Arctia plantaginis]|uniref:Uncharacterized protein n=1 Tax=Arctia plantaginis TaxID=874455 RepID=A0A8S1AZI8_ARCPL|nr:unnamed protein product [Arctia plantaginis]